MKAILGRQGANGISYVTVLQNFLMDFLNKEANADFQDAVAKNRIFFDTVTYYIRFVVTGLNGRKQLVDETTQKLVGASNFNLGYLPKFVFFAFNKVSVKYTDDSSGAGVAAKDLIGWTGVRVSVDKSVSNSELIISNGGSVILEEPTAKFLHDVAPTTGPIGETGYELDQPRILRSNELVKIELNLANTVPSTAGHTFGVEVMLHGLQTRLKSA